jgi:hypothetical protein
MRLITLNENYNCKNLYKKPACHVASKAFSVSKNALAIVKLLLKFKVAQSVSLMP